MALNITPVASSKDNYIWAIIETSCHEVIIVDPGESSPVDLFLQQQALSLKAILVTHHHWDHTNGVTELKARYQPIVYGPKQESIIGLDQTCTEEQAIHILNFPPLTVFDIPGHTAGHIAYYTPGSLFCGDTLFAAGCGRLFEGSPQQMYESLQKLASLPPDTQVYCAHEYTLNNLRFAATIEPNNQAIAERIEQVKIIRASDKPSLPSTLAEEFLTNPFLRCNEASVVAAAENHAGKNLISPAAVFEVLRKWKDNF